MLRPMGKPDFHKVVPTGDDRLRLVCRSCGHIAYENPKVITGSVVLHEDRILLCKRAIEPRKGYWTLPAGFLELGESVEEGAIREAWEEARARIQIDRVLAIYTIRHISQIHVMYRATLSEPEHRTRARIGSARPGPLGRHPMVRPRVSLRGVGTSPLERGHGTTTCLRRSAIRRMPATSIPYVRRSTGSRLWDVGAGSSQRGSR